MIRDILRWALSRPVDPPVERNCDTCRNDIRVDGRRICAGMEMAHVVDSETRREAQAMVARWRSIALDQDQRVRASAPDCAAWRAK